MGKVWGHGVGMLSCTVVHLLGIAWAPIFSDNVAMTPDSHLGT